MASFPATIKSFVVKLTQGVIEASHINDLQDEVTALETKVGVDGSVVTTSLDYQLKNPSSVNPGHKHTISAINDIVITTPSDGQGLVYQSGNWVNATTAIPDASTTVKGVNKMSVAPVSATDPIAVGDNDPRVPTQNENDALVGTSGTAVSSSNKLVDAADVSSAGASDKIVRATGTALPALSGANLTNLPVTTGYTTASATLKYSYDTEDSVTGAASLSMTKVREVQIFKSGTIRVDYDFRLYATLGATCQGRIYINGVAVGTLNSNPTINYVTFSDASLSVNSGDKVQLYVTQSASSSGSPAIYFRNMRFYYTTTAAEAINLL